MLDHGRPEEGADFFDGALDIAVKAGVDAHPGESALDHPRLWLDTEPGVAPRDDPDDLRPLETGVRDDLSQERKAPGDPVVNQRRAVTILRAGGMRAGAKCSPIFPDG